jgi:hypothetical protein
MELIHNLISLFYVLFFKVSKPSAGIVKGSADVDNIDLSMFANLYKCLKQKVGFWCPTRAFLQLHFRLIVFKTANVCVSVIFIIL